jgi:serpin B
MQSKPAAKRPSRRWRYFLLGALIEVALVGLCFSLPESGLAVRIRNFSILAHVPILALMESGLVDSAPAAVLALVLGFGVMSFCWGVLVFLGEKGIRQFLTRLGPSRRRIVRYGGGIAALAVLAWAGFAIVPDTPRPFAASPETLSVMHANNAFALGLYRQLQARPDNLFLSPYSISAALAMTSAGARGQTAVEMTNALHFSLPPEKLHPAFKTLNARLAQVQRWNRIVLKSANSLWRQQDYPFSADFTELIRENYRAEARSVDFAHAGGAAADEINRWIGRATNHRIKGGLGPGQLTPDTKLTLCNAIYFKGKWQHQFKRSDTKPGPFHVSTNETVTVPMMDQKAEFKTARSEDGSVMMLELPYAGRDLSMVILLPADVRYLPDAEHNDVHDLERKLTPENLRTWLAELDKDTPRKTSVRMPRFTTTSSLNLVPELKALGMTTAFGGDADFSGMDGTKQLYLSDVLHQSFVEVNEAGTEAAVVTLAVVGKSKGDDHFVVDRPFLFLIRDNGSGSILFLGRIMDPTK